MSNITIAPYEPTDEAAVIGLWHRCNLVVPHNDPRHDIWLKLQVQPELFFVAHADAQLVGTVMAGYDGHRGWLNYVAVAPEYRKHGIGRALVEQATAKLKALGCPKINLQVRASNTGVIAFYERLGFRLDDVVSMGKRLS